MKSLYLPLFLLMATMSHFSYAQSDNCEKLANSKLKSSVSRFNNCMAQRHLKAEQYKESLPFLEWLVGNRFNNGWASYSLGRMYHLGLGVTKNNIKAYKYLSSAAQNHDRESARYLGDMILARELSLATKERFRFLQLASNATPFTREEQEKQWSYYWAMAQMLRDAEIKGIKLDNNPQITANVIASRLPVEAYPEASFMRWELADQKDNYETRNLLIKAAKFGHSQANYEIARRHLNGNGFKKSYLLAESHLNEAERLGFVVPEDIKRQIREHKEKLAEHKRKNDEEKHAREQLEQERLIQEEAQLAAMEIPDLTASVLNRILHRHLRASADSSDKLLAPALRLPPNVAYDCDNEYCYAMAGIVKFRYQVINLENCSQNRRDQAQCEFTFILKSGTTINVGNHPGNQMLQNIYNASPIRAIASLRFDRKTWSITELNTI